MSWITGHWRKPRQEPGSRTWSESHGRMLLAYWLAQPAFLWNSGSLHPVRWKYMQPCLQTNLHRHFLSWSSSTQLPLAFIKLTKIKTNKQNQPDRVILLTTLMNNSQKWGISEKKSKVQNPRITDINGKYYFFYITYSYLYLTFTFTRNIHKYSHTSYTLTSASVSNQIYVSFLVLRRAGLKLKMLPLSPLPAGTAGARGYSNDSVAVIFVALSLFVFETLLCISWLS